VNQHHQTSSPEATEIDASLQRKTAQAVKAARSGDTQAFGLLVELYKDQLMGLCVTLMRNTGEAEELAQDVFVRAYRYLGSFDDRRPFYPWLAKIAYRLTQTRWQRQRREVGLQDEAWAQLTHNRPDDDPSIVLVADEQARHLWKAIGELPGGERAATILYYRHGMDIREVSQVLGVSTGAVKTFLFRARRHLSSALGRSMIDKPDGSTK
jgi:RNA polymerase sigma-70 factor (ECF subfamily)